MIWQYFTLINLTIMSHTLLYFLCNSLAPSFSTELILLILSFTVLIVHNIGLILGLCPTNGRRRYKETLSLIGRGKTLSSVIGLKTVNVVWNTGLESIRAYLRYGTRHCVWYVCVIPCRLNITGHRKDKYNLISSIEYMFHITNM